MLSSFLHRRTVGWGWPFGTSSVWAVTVAGAALILAILAATSVVLWQLRSGMADLAPRSVAATALVSVLAVSLLLALLLRQMQERQAQVDAGRKQAAALAAEKVMLEAIATSSSPRVLDTICRAVEAQMPEGLCSILLLDGEGTHLRHGAAPGLPKEYSDAIDGVAIGPTVGSCGTAAFLGRRVIVTDITTDPLWAEYRDLAARYGLRACWSTPIQSAAGKLLGTFAIYYREPRAPSPIDLGWAERATHLAGIAIERQQAEQTMAAAKEEAERANRSKSVFLANMSHELRTPLNAIIGFSEGLGSGIFGTLSQPQQEYLRDIREAGTHLLGLINDLLDLSRIDAGKLQLAEQMVDVSEILVSCTQSLAGAATAEKVEVAVELPASLPRLHADATRVRQIVANLMSNAIKFSSAGGRVTVRPGLRPDGGMAIAIADSGIGMAPEDIAVALEPFRQVDGTRARQRGGTGLGLPLAKQLLEMHGGSLEIKSAPGVGTTVQAVFPVTRVVPASLVALVDAKRPA